MMKKLAYIFACVVALTTAACSDWIDVAPKTEVETEDLFTSESGFKNALIGIYGRMTSQGTYGRNMTFGYIERLVQRYDVGGTAYNQSQAALLYDYENDNESRNAQSTIWREMYRTIANINNLLEYLETNGDYITTDGYYNLIKGEALGLRAMYHFDLLRLFGPLWSNRSAESIPYVTSSDREIRPLLSADSVMACVMADLEEAANLLRNVDPVTTEGPRNESGGTEGNDMYYLLYRMYYFAVQALRARAALWMQDYTSARDYAVETIQAATNNSMFQLITPTYFASYTLDRIFEPEVLFALYTNQRGDLFDTYFSESNDARNLLALAENRQTVMYENTTDYRSQRYWTSAENTEASIFVRYEDQTASANLEDQWERIRYMIPLIRLSELYLIAAECVGLQGEMNVADAVELYLNPLRQARNEMPLETTISTTQLREYIQNEYIREFVGEGQTFFFYKRNELSTIPSGEAANATIGMDASRYVVPLPDSETNQRE